MQAQDQIEAEAARIRERLVSHPHPYEHGALYAAQQALAWVLNPDLSASPVDAILRLRGANKDCRHSDRQGPSEDTDGLLQNSV